MVSGVTTKELSPWFKGYQ